jgi:crossover junction endodeoxyribonuclease RusA
MSKSPLKTKMPKIPILGEIKNKRIIYYPAKIILKGNPISTNQIYRRHGHIIYLSKEGKQLKEAYQLSAKTQWKLPILNCELEVRINLYFKDKRRRDIDNWNKIVLDSLTGIVWKDDSQIVKLTIEKHIGEPKIEVEIATYPQGKLDAPAG